MIKIGIRHNLIYPSLLSISNFARNLEVIFMSQSIKFSGLYTIIMFFSEFVSGLIFYQYNIVFNSKKNKTPKISGIYLIQYKKKFSFCGQLKLYIYSFLTALFDFLDFTIKTLYLPGLEKNMPYISESLYLRLNIVLTLFAAFFCYFLLKIPIYKHQKCSLIILVFCFLLVLITEYLVLIINFNESNNLTTFTYSLLFRIISQLFFSFQDTIEKYLFKYKFINPYQLVMIEGIFGILLSMIGFLFENPLKDTKESYKNYKKKYEFIILLIIFALIYFLLSGIKNIYRVLTNDIYNPATKNLIDVIFHPILIIIYFCKNDFKITDKKQRIIYFIFNLIISIVMVISCCIYNELLVLFCCGLEYNTHREIANRATISEKKDELKLFYNDDNYSDEENDD